MKRDKTPFSSVYEWKNLVDALGMVRRDKTEREDMLAFMNDWQGRLREIQHSFASGAYDLGHYHSFPVFEPKMRLIYAAPIRERIMHHAVIDKVGKTLERPLIADTYACRPGLGQWKAVYRAADMAGRFAWCLKLDIRKYFDSIDQRILFARLKRLFKDARFLDFFRVLLETYETAPGKGLPIGNLTSQYFANLYLDPFDRFCQGKHRGYLRYMDDMLVFGGYEDLKALLKAGGEFLASHLELAIKKGGSLHRSEEGADFLGCRIFPGKISLNRASKKRLIGKLRNLKAGYLEGIVSGEELRVRSQALLAFARHADSFSFGRKAALEGGEKLRAEALRFLAEHGSVGIFKSVR